MNHDGPTALRSARHENKLKQREFAARIEKSPSLVCEWEKGTRRPSFADALKLERFFGTDETGAKRLPVEVWGFDRETALRREDAAVAP